MYCSTSLYSKSSMVHYPRTFLYPVSMLRNRLRRSLTGFNYFVGASVCADLSPRRTAMRWPTLAIDSIAGFSSDPSFVRLYSTVGGEVGCTCRCTILSSARRLRRWVSIFAEIPGMSAFSSVKRRGLFERYQMILGVQAPPMMPRQKVRGHWFGGSSTVFFLRGTMVTKRKPHCDVTARNLVYFSNLDS